MGFRFRKSFKAGPVRVNLSKSGIGYSVGTKGFRVTKKAKGGIRTTASIPGTGISYVSESSSKKSASRPSSATGHSSGGSRQNPSGFWKWVGIWFLIYVTSGVVCGGILRLPNEVCSIAAFVLASIGTAAIATARKRSSATTYKPVVVPPDELPEFQDPDDEPPFQEDPPEVEKKRKRPGCALIVIAVWIIGIVGSCMPESEPMETQPVETTPAIIATTPATTAPQIETTAPSTAPAETADDPTVPDETEPATVQTEPPQTEPPIVQTEPPQTEPPVPETTERKTRDYVLNTNTGKFHSPSCREVKKIKDTNRLDFNGTREEVIAMDYKPCGICNP